MPALTATCSALRWRTARQLSAALSDRGLRRVATAAAADAAERKSRPIDRSLALVPLTNDYLLPGVSISKPRWSADEEDDLIRVISQEFPSECSGTQFDWGAISKAIGSRNAHAIRAKYRYRFAYRAAGNREQGGPGGDGATAGGRSAKAPKCIRWSSEEDDALQTAVAMYGVANWPLVADFVGTRTRVQCSYRWKKIHTPISGMRMPQHHWARAPNTGSPIDKLSKLGGRSVLPDRKLIIQSILAQQRREALQEEARQGLPATDSSQTGPERSVVVGRAIAAPYSAEEDARIVRLVRLLGTQWILVAQLLNEANENEGVRTRATSTSGPALVMQRRLPRNVMARYTYLVRQQHVAPPPPAAPHKRQRRTDRRALRLWTPEEDRQLERAVNTVARGDKGNILWADVAQLIQGAGRTSLMCRNRWTEMIGSHLSHAPFTLAEDTQLWPFVVGPGDGNRVELHTPTGRRRNAMTARYSNGGSNVAEVGVGWVAASMPGRSTLMLRKRIRRLQTTIHWLHAVIKVENPQDHIELVHRFTNAPLRLAVPRRAKSTTK